MADQELKADENGDGLDGYVETAEHPSFDIENVQLQFELKHSLRQVCVKNNLMYLILASSVYRINLNNPSQVDFISVSAGGNIKLAWLHPNGLHLIVQVNKRSYYYLNESSSQFQLLAQFKNLEVRFVSFTQTSATKEATGEIIIGTAHHLYVSSIHYTIERGKEQVHQGKNPKSVFKLSLKLNNLLFSNNSSRIHVFTDTEMMMWDCFDTSFSELVRVFKQQPHSKSLPSKDDALFLLESAAETYCGFWPATLAIYSNDIELALSGKDSLDLNSNISRPEVNQLQITKHHLLLLDSGNRKIYIVNKLSNMNAILDLNTVIDSDEPILNITSDDIYNTFWLYTSNSIYELVIRNESSSVWYNYYKLGKFEEALKCLEDPETKDFHKKDMILKKQGYHCLQEGDFGSELDIGALKDDLVQLQITGVKTLARLTESFEKICLMILNMKPASYSSNFFNSSYISQVLLIRYLSEKLHLLKSSKPNQIKFTIIASWVVELLLRTMNQLEDDLSSNFQKDGIITKMNLPYEEEKEKKTKVFKDLNLHFENFIRTNYKVLDSKTVYQIMKDLNSSSKLLYYVEFIRDYAYLFEYYISLELWEDAIKTMIKIDANHQPKEMELLYRRSLLLLINSPKRTVETWLRLEHLDYDNLLSSILIYNKNNVNIKIKENYTIIFLQRLFSEKNVKSKSLYNYFLSLLITYPTNSPEESLQVNHLLKKFLSSKYLKFGNSKKISLYDPNFLLRLCMNFEKHEVVVMLLINEFNLYEQALRYALEHDLLGLAEHVLTRYENEVHNIGDVQPMGPVPYNSEGITTTPTDLHSNILLEDYNYNFRKKLWLLFAKYIIDCVSRGKQMINSATFDSCSAGLNSNVNSLSQGMRLNSDGHSGGKSLENGTLISKDETPDAYASLKNLSEALKYLLQLSKQNLGILDLKDLLPLFPETIMVSSFKDEIVKSLNEYNMTINQLSLEMEESLKTTHSIKEQLDKIETADLKGRIYTIIEPGEPCGVCGKVLISKNFACFPNCHHNFHKDCLVKFHLKLKDDYRFKKVFEDFKKSSSLKDKDELDSIILKDCILCGDSNINSIDINLIDLQKDKNELENWKV